MPKMSQKRKKELSLFLNDAGRVEYNILCRRCVHECKDKSMERRKENREN